LIFGSLFAAQERQNSVEATPADSWRENAKSPTERTDSSKTGAGPHQPALNPSGAFTLKPPFKVALDVGHTPKKGGAVSARGMSEYEFNYRLVDELAQKLQFSRTVQCFVVNPEREEISLPKRAEQAQEHGADLFLAIHHDSVKESYLTKWEFNGKPQKYCDDFHGYSIFISEKSAKPLESLAFANALGRALLKEGFSPTLHHETQENRTVLDREKGICLFDDLIVLKAAKMPAVLLECGVIVNREEETNLNNKAYRVRLVQAICNGIESLASPASR
jgi:N-acetylmuramoyl-L-alanine amidase